MFYEIVAIEARRPPTDRIQVEAVLKDHTGAMSPYFWEFDLIDLQKKAALNPKANLGQLAMDEVRNKVKKQNEKGIPFDQSDFH